MEHIFVFVSINVLKGRLISALFTHDDILCVTGGSLWNETQSEDGDLLSEARERHCTTSECAAPV